MENKTFIKTGCKEFDDLIPLVRSFLAKDTLDLFIDGKRIRGYRSPDAKSVWIRDYSDMMRGFKYFERDMKSVVEHFAETQAENGRVFDYFTTFPEKLPCERENWTKYVRAPVEADVEYRFVKAAYLAWQACCDDEWIEHLLPKLEMALQYIINHPWYWDKNHQLVKRPYTIDTWDFAYTAGAHEWLQFQIDDNTFWGFMHGDNSGYYEAFKIMSFLYEYFGNSERSEYWCGLAENTKKNMNEVCWNGDFYTHFVKLGAVDIPGVDESKQLSLSNPMDINRGAADHEQAVSIIREYLRRKESSGAFAEWFSIDPPFPDGVFGDEKLVAGAYVNGGIMPLVGGELAKAAFDQGFEKYGVDILKRYYSMASEKRETYLWYFPDGMPAGVETSTSPEAEPTDGWGSSAMLYALIEGLAGIEDMQSGYNKVRISPRWIAADIEKVEVLVTYAASGRGIGYLFERSVDRIKLEVQAEGSDMTFHVLLPRDTTVAEVESQGEKIDFSTFVVEHSKYVDFEKHVVGNRVFEIVIKD